MEQWKAPLFHNRGGYICNLYAPRKEAEAIEVIKDIGDFTWAIVSLVTVLPKQIIQFAPIGLVDLLNCGGAI